MFKSFADSSGDLNFTKSTRKPEKQRSEQRRSRPLICDQKQRVLHQKFFRAKNLFFAEIHVPPGKFLLEAAKEAVNSGKAPRFDSIDSDQVLDFTENSQCAVRRKVFN